MSIPSLLGQIIFFNHHRGFGRIRCDEIDETVFVHFSAIEGESRVLVPHELVRFDYQENPKGPRATRVQRLSQRLRGNILQLKRGKGQVSALPGGQRFDFEIEDLIGGKEEETSPGVAVEFSPFDAHTAKELVIVDPRPPLAQFSALPNWQAQLQRLEGQLLPETWGPMGYSSQTVLGVYLHRTFARLKEENKIERGRTDQGQAIAVFNTGLLAQDHQAVVAVMKVNEQPYKVKGKNHLPRPKWEFAGFVGENHPLLQHLEHPPSPPYYHEQPDALVYDPTRPIEVAWSDLLTDKEQTSMGVEVLDRALRASERRAKLDFGRVVPGYYAGEVRLFLPIALSHQAPPSLVAVLNRIPHRYEVIDIISRSEAYPLARQIGPIHSTWLSPGPSSTVPNGQLQKS